MTATGDERPGHRVLTHDVIGLCGCSNTARLEVAARPKRDMDAEKSAEIENENDAVRPKCDDEAAAVDEDAPQTSKKRRIIEEQQQQKKN